MRTHLFKIRTHLSNEDTSLKWGHTSQMRTHLFNKDTPLKWGHTFLIRTHLLNEDTPLFLSLSLSLSLTHTHTASRKLSLLKIFHSTTQHYVYKYVSNPIGENPGSNYTHETLVHTHNHRYLYLCGKHVYSWVLDMRFRNCFVERDALATET